MESLGVDVYDGVLNLVGDLYVEYGVVFFPTESGRVRGRDEEDTQTHESKVNKSYNSFKEGT